MTQPKEGAPPRRGTAPVGERHEARDPATDYELRTCARPTSWERPTFAQHVPAVEMQALDREMLHQLQPNDALDMWRYYANGSNRHELNPLPGGSALRGLSAFMTDWEAEVHMVRIALNDAKLQAVTRCCVVPLARKHRIDTGALYRLIDDMDSASCWDHADAAFRELCDAVEHSAHSGSGGGGGNGDAADADLTRPTPLTFPIANAELARASGLGADFVSKKIREALTAANAAIPVGGKGKKREWTEALLRRALPHLPNGELKNLLIQSGLQTRIETDET